MPSFIADLHIHSKHSRATARNLDLAHLYIAAQLKGISVVGTGDFTHPAWFSELSEQLVPAEPGLYKLKPELARACDEKVPPSCRRPVRFILQTEISNIYKRDDATRKNHNLVFFPDLKSVATFNHRLDRLGNIQSDGRPILGLDARLLLEIMLETNDIGFLVPAHIWTPWFSMLGSKSGFDSIDECFGDLSGHIFAVETGLSSDPPMNWRVSFLDGISLISNSDAHSPAKLGREANRFETEMSFYGIRSALASGDPNHFKGTYEFFPEEGKYHMDGHRKCGLRFTPEESRTMSGICPQCQKPLTLGVYNRVIQLADRPDHERPFQTHPFSHLVPLTDVLSELFSVGAGSKRVQSAYEGIIDTLGSELAILDDLPPEEIKQARVPLLDEAIDRIRAGRIVLNPGYDGAFGTIQLFTPDEKKHLTGQATLFQIPNDPVVSESPAPQPWQPEPKSEDSDGESTDANRLNPGQQAVVDHEFGPLIVIAGPGTGKTLTLTRRIAELMDNRHVAPESILAVTFTQKAAVEMRHRLRHMSEQQGAGQPLIATFHGFCYQLLSEDATEKRHIIPEVDRRNLVADVVASMAEEHNAVPWAASAVLAEITNTKQRLIETSEAMAEDMGLGDPERFAIVYRRYQQWLDAQSLYDFDDLVSRVVKRLETDAEYAKRCRRRFSHLFVDEYQDVNAGQYRLIRALSPTGENLCVIGDPDQAIYGFRGSDVGFFNRFSEDFPSATVVNLQRNYRSSRTIVDGAVTMMAGDGRPAAAGALSAGRDGYPTIDMIEAPSAKAEAVAIGKTIEGLVGGTGFHSMDFGSVALADEDLGFGDMVVLARTHRLCQQIADGLIAGGIPCQTAHQERFDQKPLIQELLALVRWTAGIANLSDLDRIAGILDPGISRDTARQVKSWCLTHRLDPKDIRYSVRHYPLEGLSARRQQRLYDFLGTLFEFGQKTDGLPVSRRLYYFMELSRLGSRIQDNQDALDLFHRLVTVADGYGNDVRGFLAAVALQQDTDALDDLAQRVSVMTLHAAKGLEFPVVFIAGCEDGILPKTDDRFDNRAEERRLLYVGMTRAKERLFLTTANSRRIHGKTSKQALSPFLGDIRQSLLNRHPDLPMPRHRIKPAQLDLFGLDGDSP